jgi:MFS family permease
MFSIATLFFMFEFMLRTLIGTFQPEIMKDLSLGSVSFSLISSTSFQVIYGLMQIPVGLYIKKFGLKKTLTFATLCCALGCIGFACSHNFWTAILARIVMGLGASFGFIILLVVIYQWLPEKNTGLFIGLGSFIGTMGPMASAMPIHYLTEALQLSWQSLFISLGLVALTMSCVSIVFMQENNNKPEAFSFKRIHPPEKTVHLIINFFKQNNIMMIALYSGLSFFSIEYLSENEARAYLHALNFTPRFSNQLISLSWLMYAITCPILGYISDKIRKRKPPLVFASICLCVGINLFVIAPFSKSLLVLSFILIGIGSAGGSMAFAMIAELVSTKHMPVVMGFNNTFIMMLGASLTPLITTLVSTAHTYKFIYVQMVLSSLMLISVASLFLIMLARETFCRKQVGFILLANI